MKKLLAIILLLPCVLCSCSPDISVSDFNNSKTNEVKEDEESNITEPVQQEDSDVKQELSGAYVGELTLSLSFGERTGMFSGELDENGLPTGHGTFTSKNPDGTEWTYEGDWKEGHWDGVGKTSWSDGQSYIGEFANDMEIGEGKLTLLTGEIYEGYFFKGAMEGDGKLSMPDGTTFEGKFSDNLNAKGTYTDADGILYNAEMIDGELTLDPVIDFFSDIERQAQYKEMYQSYRYSELIEYVSEYLSSNNVTPLDSAYSVLDLLTPLTEYEDSWNVEFDDFDGTYTLSFKETDEISSENSIVVNVENTSLDIKIGFRKKGWLFFDSIELSIDGKRAYGASVKSYDVTRNVISGSTIEEYCLCGFYDNVIESLKDADTVILRFENSKSEEVYDHTLSQAEKDALYCGLLLRVNNKELSNLLSRYNQKHQ